MFVLIEELARKVHENAVAHGWWEDKRETPEILALIHSEWSEALEEARAGKPMAYIEAFTGSQRDPEVTIIERAPDGRYIAEWGQEYTGKPEGIAVELIDGCIRIFDFLGERNVECKEKDGSPSTVESLYRDENRGKIPDKVPELIAWLHLETATALSMNPIVDVNVMNLLEAAAIALSWVKKQGFDPLEILLEKHRYNETRPYKHGKRF